jgi:hypothetical protein
LVVVALVGCATGAHNGSDAGDASVEAVPDDVAMPIDAGPDTGPTVPLGSRRWISPSSGGGSLESSGHRLVIGVGLSMAVGRVASSDHELTLGPIPDPL